MNINLFKKYFFHAFLASFLITLSTLVIIITENMGEVGLKPIIVSILEISAAIIIILFILSIINMRLVWFVPLGLILNFQYENLFNLFSNYINISPLIFIACIGIIWILSILIFWNTKYEDYKNVNYILSLTIFVGSLAQSFLIFNKEVSEVSIQPLITSQEFTPKSEYLSKELPDIIYIVPDRYASYEVLDKFYNFDNSDFYEALEKRGFIIPKNSNSNYPNTYASLLSTLNLSHIESSPEKIPHSTFYPQIKNSIAFKSLTEAGYQFINIDNWWNGTQEMELADKNFYLKNVFNFSITPYLMYNTPVYKILTRYYPQINHRFSCSIQEMLFDNLINEAANQEENSFIFSHQLAPHAPYLFDRDGNCFTERSTKLSQLATDHVKTENDYIEGKKNYIEYLIYTNKKLIEAFDARLKKNKDFIFVIQSDEGPYPPCIQLKRKCSKNDWRIKTGNINAFFYSGKHNIGIEDLKTPINNFNYIFNIVFGEAFEKLPDNIYVNHNPSHHILGNNQNFYFRKINYE